MTNITNADPVSAYPEPSDINLMDLIIALGHQKILISLTVAAAALIGVVVSLVTPTTYVAVSIIMPNQQNNGGALASLAGLGNLAGLAGIGASVKSSDEMYVAFMRGQSAQLALAESLNLKTRYGAKTNEDVRVAIDHHVNIVADKKTGLINIYAEDGDAVFAADLANAQVQELNNLLSRLAVTEAQQKRAYYEQQIAKTHKTLAEVEARFKNSNRKSGVQAGSMMAESSIRASIDLRGQIASKEVQLLALGQFATPQNPEMLRLAGEIAGMKSLLQKYERGNGESSKELPQEQDATLAFRELKTQEAMLDAFVRQLEIAKVDEAKEGPIIQVVERARAPEIRSKPQRTKLVVAFAMAGLLAGFLLASVRAYIVAMNSRPDGAKKLRDLKLAWLDWRQS